jgi:hypothetical protein
LRGHAWPGPSTSYFNEESAIEPMKTKQNKAAGKAANPVTPSGAASRPKTLRIPITNVFDGNDYSARNLVGSNRPGDVILDTGGCTAIS